MAAELIAAVGGLAAGYATYRVLGGDGGEPITGRVCLITGAGGGVGREAALEFAKAGCKLVLWDIHLAGLEGTRDHVQRVTAAKCLIQVVDVSNPAIVYKAAAEANEWANDQHVSILVNNAGVVAGKAFLDTSDAGIQKTFGVNALAHFWTCKAFLPAMIAHKKGHVVTVASAAGLTVAPFMLPYGASKHAAVGFAHGLRKELRVLGHTELRTSLICPAHIATKLFEGFNQPIFPALSPEYVAQQVLDAVLRNQPLKIMPAIANPAFQRFFLPLWAEDKIESLAGLDNMMSGMDMQHADSVTREVSLQTASKL